MMKKGRNYGVISGWSTVQADTQLDIRGDIDKATEIEDILEIIRSIQLKVNSIDGVGDILDQHIADPNNPHNIDITITDIDIYTVLYAAYVEMYGADITQNEFNDLFNFVRRFATEYDVDNHTNLTSTINLHIAEYIINRHNTDPEAHSNIKQLWIPGQPIVSPPTVSIEPVVGFDFISSRDSILNVFDVTGNIREISPKRISTSYYNGVPTLPIFGERTNYIRNSKKPSVSIEGCSDAYEAVGLNVRTPLLDNDMFVVRETPGSGEVSVEIDLSGVGVTMTNDQFVFSVGIFPVYSKYVQFQLTNSDGTYDVVRIDLVTKNSIWTHGSNASPIYVDSRVNINDLSNGWFIIGLTFDQANSSSMMDKIKILPCEAPVAPDTFGLPITSRDENRIDLALWQYQMELGYMPSTPIFTTSSPVTKPADKVSIPATMNSIMGAVSITALTPNVLINSYGQGVFPLYSFYNSSNGSVSCHSSMTDDTLDIKVNNKNNAPMETLSSGHYGTTAYPVIQTALGYTEGLLSYGFAGVEPAIKAINSSAALPEDVDENPLMARLTDPLYQDPSNVIQTNVDRLYIGFNSLYNKYLESYMIEFLYYPLFVSRDNIEYLLQEHYV